MLRKFTITRSKIRIILGGIWLLDGLLQLQPKMFTSNFANQVLAPASQGQPSFVSGGVHFAIHTILLHPALFDALFAIIQLSLGVLILWKRTTRYGLIASVVWGLAVWYFGEGLGGLAGGQATLLSGAPGAALIYALLALALMPDYDKRGVEMSRRPADWLAYVWMIVWMGGGLLLLWASRGMSSMIGTMVSGMANGAPHWLATTDNHAGNWIAAQGDWLLITATIIFIALGFSVMLPRMWRTLGISCGIILSAVFWVIGQGLGGYYTGLATDPNTGPLIILLGIAVIGTKQVSLNLFGSSE